MDPLYDKYPTWSPYSYAVNNPLTVVDPDGRDTLSVVIRKNTELSDENTNIWNVSLVLISNGNRTPVTDENGEPVEMYMVGKASSDEKKGNGIKDENPLVFQIQGRHRLSDGSPSHSKYQNEIFLVGTFVGGKRRGQFIHFGKNYEWFDGCKRRVS